MADRRAGVVTDITRQQAALELLRRKRARSSLVEYARSIDIPGAPVGTDPDGEQFKTVETSMAHHHRLICAAMQQTMETPMGRTIITMPPGSAKSSYGSVVSPSWALSRWPGYRIIIASYNTKIAAKQSRKARALCRSARHISVWPDRPILAMDQKAVDQWALSNGSEFMAAGMLAGITGNRANGVIIDDPLKGREEADSEVIRDKVYEEFEDSVKTRLLPGGWIALITTRWHEDDPAGRILPEGYAGQSGRILCRDGQYWNVLNIPAKAEHEDDPLGRAPGEYLWPEWFPEAHWAQWERNPRAARTWSALFQQKPSPGEGLEFKREWFKRYDPDAKEGTLGARPKHLTIYGASDYATKEDKGDYTEHGIMGLGEAQVTIPVPDENGHVKMTKASPFYFLDWWYGQKTTDATIAAKVALVQRHKPRRWWNEGGPIDNAISPAVHRAMRENVPRVHVEIVPLTSIKNKAVKLASFQARAAAGLVYFPINRPWADRVIDQLCAFPAGKYDDGADVCGLLGRGVDDMMLPHAPTATVRKSLVPFSVAWLEYTDEESNMKVRYT
jgi:predicted phage terminase large subunit-like protein